MSLANGLRRFRRSRRATNTVRYTGSASTRNRRWRSACPRLWNFRWQWDLRSASPLARRCRWRWRAAVLALIAETRPIVPRS
eukprot:3997499-Amphidinium_carterae.1